MTLGLGGKYVKHIEIQPSEAGGDIMHKIYIIAAGSELEIPVLPERLSMKTRGRNKRQSVIGVGDVLRLEQAGLWSIEWESFFPLHDAPYVTGTLTPPREAVQFLRKAKESRKPVRLLIVTGEHDLISYVGIDHFSYEERFGEPGDIYYSIKLTQWKDTSPRRVIIDMQTKTAVISQPKRPGEPNLPENYTVQADDTLWLIAKRYYDDGSRYTVIYDANKAVIDPPNHKYGNPKYTIYPGQVLFVPPLSSLGNAGSYKENPSTGAGNSSGGSLGGGSNVNELEIQLWGSLMKDPLSDAQKLSKLKGFYPLGGLTDQFILKALSETDIVDAVSAKIKVFVTLLSNINATAAQRATIWCEKVSVDLDRVGAGGNYNEFMLHSAVLSLINKAAATPEQLKLLSNERISRLVADDPKALDFLIAIKGQRLVFPRSVNIITYGFMEDSPSYAAELGWHYGIDLANGNGQYLDLYGMGYGEVLYTGGNSDTVLGVRLDVLYKNVICHHDGKMRNVVVKYGHLSEGSVKVKKGDRIDPRQKRQLATMGATGKAFGVHLHLETIIFEQAKENFRKDDQQYPSKTINNNDVSNMLNPLDILCKAEGMAVKGSDIHKDEDGERYNKDKVNGVPLLSRQDDIFYDAIFTEPAI